MSTRARGSTGRAVEAVRRGQPHRDDEQQQALSDAQRGAIDDELLR
jgi:hypothetical protein